MGRKVYGYGQAVRMYGQTWTVDYSVGARCADVLMNGHAVDIIQVRDWDFTRTASEQTGAIPSRRRVSLMLMSWAAEHGAEYAGSLA